MLACAYADSGIIVGLYHYACMRIAACGLYAARSIEAWKVGVGRVFPITAFSLVPNFFRPMYYRLSASPITAF